jgi:hypothetical protein
MSITPEQQWYADVDPTVQALKREEQAVLRAFRAVPMELTSQLTEGVAALKQEAKIFADLIDEARRVPPSPNDDVWRHFTIALSHWANAAQALLDARVSNPPLASQMVRLSQAYDRYAVELSAGGDAFAASGMTAIGANSN